MVRLNNEQEEASKILEGNLLINASAGTGKTTTIVERYVNLLSNGVSPERIMMTTFTNKAAKDMVEKIKLRTNKISPFIGTMHSLFLKILREYSDVVFLGKERTLITDAKEQKKILKEIFLKEGIEPESNSYKYFLGWISKFKNRCILAEDLVEGVGLEEMKMEGKITELMDDEEIKIDSSWRGKVNVVYKKYQIYLDKHNLMDFDEVLILTYKLFRDNEKIRERYRKQFKAIMVDEAQDLNVVQVNILDFLVNDNLCLIGDDCQNIYEWRGSSNDLVFRFRENENEVCLKDNYRSTGEIIEAVNKVIDSMRFKIDKQLVLTREKKEDIRFEVCYNLYEEMDFVVSKIQDMIEDNESLDEIAILFRTNRIGKIFQRELLKNKIPCHLSKSVDFFDRLEIKDFISFLKLKVNPNSFLDFERVACLIRGFGPSKINFFREMVELKGVSYVESLDYIEDLNLSYLIKEKLNFLRRALVENEGYVDLFLKDFGYYDYLRNKYKEDEFSERVENLEVLLNLLEDFRFGSLNVFLDSIIEIDKREKTSGKVILSTIHAAKGLEWKNVFLVSVNEKVLPFYKKDLSNVKRDSELRLFYVGISRAKDNLFITCSRDYKFNEPSSFLEIIKKKEKVKENFVNSWEELQDENWDCEIGEDIFRR